MAPMKAMKAMKASMKTMKKGMKSAMKAMKAKKAMKVSVKGKKWQVLKGTRAKTNGGLKKSDLKKNKQGKVVSAKQSALAKKRFNQTIGKWIEACKKARKALGVKGMCVVGGKTKEGQALLAKARSFYKK